MTIGTKVAYTVRSECKDAAGLWGGMAKITITLPNTTTIILDWDEIGPVHEVLGQVVRELHLDALSRENSGSVYPVDGNASAEKGTDASAEADVQSTPSSHRRSNGTRSGQTPNGVSHAANGSPTYGTSAIPPVEVRDDLFDLNRYSEQAREDFKAFCQSINPTGDMRRVVVAAEGASRFFGLEGVTADEVGDLFDLVGWRRANSFTQTIRNAARAKFGWLERIPGRSGRYAATEFGRNTTLSL